MRWLVQRNARIARTNPRRWVDLILHLDELEHQSKEANLRGVRTNTDSGQVLEV